MRGSVPHPSLCQLFVRAWFQACTMASKASTNQGSASSNPAPFGCAHEQRERDNNKPPEQKSKPSV